MEETEDEVMIVGTVMAGRDLRTQPSIANIKKETLTKEEYLDQLKKQEHELQELENKRKTQDMQMKVKDQALTTMVRDRHALSDAVYNSVRHIKGVGKRSDYTEDGLVTLVEQIALEKQTLDPPPKDVQKTVLPSKPIKKKVLNLLHK